MYLAYVAGCVENFYALRNTNDISKDFFYFLTFPHV